MDCGCECDPTFRTCRNCGNNKLTKETIETCTFEAGRVNAELHPYSGFIDYDTLSHNIQCMIGEPDFENPNSYHLLSKLFKKLESGRVFHRWGTVCKWLFVECDGLLYQLIQDIIENVWKCSVCSQEHCTDGVTGFPIRKLILVPLITFFGHFAIYFGNNFRFLQCFLIRKLLLDEVILPSS